MKPKSNRKGDGTKQSNLNTCQTPDYALDPLLPYITHLKTIWEPAAGQGYLSAALEKAGHVVVRSELLAGQDFFVYRPDEAVDGLVTNPPYNPTAMKPKWIDRCYALGLPWANLMPVETLGSGEAQRLFDRYGMELILLDKRVNFKMPYKGWGGKGAQFPVAWFTSGLNIGRPITYAHIYRRSQEQLSLFSYAESQLALFEVQS